MSGQEWLDNEQPEEGTLFAELRWHGESTIVYSQAFDSCTIGEAAERAVAGWIGEHGIPDKVPVATVYWANGAKFGPFPVEVSITIEATCLRGGV